MNRTVVIFIIEMLVVAVSVGGLFFSFRKEKQGKIMRVISCIGMVGGLLPAIFWNTVSAPVIDRTENYSAIKLYTDGTMKIEYRISTSDDSDEWIEYEEPFTLEHDAVIYARARTLFYTSEQVYRDAYVAENGLVYFGTADKPGGSIVEIDASFILKDAMNEESGNHYIGYELKKSDFEVIGTDLNGDEHVITDFSYSPKVLGDGKNDIKIEYEIISGISEETHVYVNGDEPEMVKLTARYIGDTVYMDTVLDNDDFLVKAVYEDGTEEAITDFSLSYDEFEEGVNQIIITKDRFSVITDVNVINRDTITSFESEPNDDIQDANQIDVNVKYSGCLQDNQDIDYYKLKLGKKGKLVIRMTHVKIDDDAIYWIATLLGENDDERLKMKSMGSVVTTNSSPARVTPGTYYVRVSRDSYADQNYELTVLFEEEDDSYESEPNDDISSQAMNIDVNQSYTGNLTNKEDVDYYNFTISEKQKVWIDFAHEKSDSGDKYWDVALYSDSDGELLSFSSTGEMASNLSDSVRLPAGNYYICIQSYYWSDIDYTFCVHAQPEDSGTENEDNGDYNRATVISIGSSIVGNIQSSDDLDFYKFELDGTTTIHLTFQHEQVDSSDTFWKIELHSKDTNEAIKNDENDDAVRIKGNSSGNISSTWTSLPGGTYYLKIYRDCYNNMDYTVTLS